MSAQTTLEKLNSVRKRLRFTIKKSLKMAVSKDASYYIRCARKPINPQLVFYESHHGAGMVCNPYAIFRALVVDPQYSHLWHVWAVDSSVELARLRQEYRHHPNVRFMLRSSREYLETIATAKYLVQNTSFPAYFFKRPGQIYISTWHSITVKKLAYDIPNGNFGSRNMVRNLLMADYVLSPNSFMTDIFRNSFRLQGLFPGRILQFGFPRNDTTIRANRQRVIDKLRSYGIDIDPTRRVILYAPTWRGDSVTTVDGSVDALQEFREKIESRIDVTQYQLLIKPHQYHFKAMNPEQRSSGDYVPREIDANEILAAVDILVSDYSSIFLDFLVTGRPILFYVPDQSEYQTNRGLYFNFEELPGPTTEEVGDIASWINDIEQISEEYRAAREETRLWACAHDDGRVSERVIKTVFGGDLDQPGIVTDFISPQKKRLLIYGGGFGANGVTAALLALLPLLDREKYDITVAGIVSKGASADNFEKLHEVRAMARTGSFLLNRWETLGFQYVKRYGLNGPLARVFRPEAALKRDFDRCFGSATFDYLIDYSGYGTIFPSVFRQHPGSMKIIWQHADLSAELLNRSKRRLRQYRDNTVSKTGLMNVYAAFDKIVACGPAVMDVNMRALGSPTTMHKFTYANNVIDASRVRRLSDVDSLVDFDGPRILARMTVSDDGSRHLYMVPNDSPEPSSADPLVKFVTMGRLSPEKNHESLLRGFAAFVESHPNSRLYIIGSGALEQALRRLVRRLGLNSVVTLTGALENPFSVIKQCDCFILPSLHEGNPLVVPEVRMLGLPIILSRFESAPSACVPEGQYMIGFAPEDIRSGFEAFVAGRVPTKYQFDVDARNAEAVAQFEDILLCKPEAR